MAEMAELPIEEAAPPLPSNDDLNTSAAPEMIKVTIDEEDEPPLVANSVESNNSSQVLLHDHSYGACPVSLNSADPFFGQNGEPFPLLDGLGDYVDGQGKAPVHKPAEHPIARTIRTPGSSIAVMNYVDSKSREDLLKRPMARNVVNRPREDVYVLSGRAFDNNRIIEQKKLQPGSIVNKFPMRSAIKPPGIQQNNVGLSRQFSSPNSISANNEQPNMTFYQQRQPHRSQQPIILKATPRILQPVPSAFSRRPPVQRQNIPQRKQPNDEESAILDVVNEEEMRNQKFFQKQIGNQLSMQPQPNHQNMQPTQRQVTTSISNTVDDSSDPHGYFHKFQQVRHQPTNLIQSPPRHDFARQPGYAAPKPYYQSPQQPQQFGRLSQPGIGQPQQFIPHDQYSTPQNSSFQSQSPVRPRVRKPLIETTESPQRTPKDITLPLSAKSATVRGRKKKDPDSVDLKAKRKSKNDSYNENDAVEDDVEGVDYTTRCICGMKNNDPNMISCDSCEVWQHMVCMGINPTAKLEHAEYKCEQCNPRPLKNNREQAAAIQRAYLANLKDKSRTRKSSGKTPKPTKELKKPSSQSISESQRDKSNQRRSSISVAAPAGKPENKFIETKLTRGVRKILDKLSPGDEQLQVKLTEPKVQTLVVAPNVYGVVSKEDVQVGDPIFEYKASLSLRDERGSQNLSSKFFGNLIQVIPGQSGDGELIFADASRHSDIFSAKVRKSCQPNAEIRHFIAKDRDNEEILRLFVVAREPIENCTEITIPLDLEYRGNEIAEIDCACRTSNYPNQAGSFSPNCPVAEYLKKKETEEKVEVSPPKVASPIRKAPASPKAKVQTPASPKPKQSERRRTTSNQQAASAAPIQKSESKPESSPPSTKTPTPLPMELEIANILSQDLPRSNSNTGTAKSLTTSPSRRSPVKSGAAFSSKKTSEKSAKKSIGKVKKDLEKKKSPVSRRSEAMSREIASLFDDNKFLSSSVEVNESGRSLRQRGQVKKEEPETPKPSSSKSPSQNRRGQNTTPSLPPTASSNRRSKRSFAETEVKEEPVDIAKLDKFLDTLASNFKLTTKVRELAKKSRHYNHRSQNN